MANIRKVDKQRTDVATLKPGQRIVALPMTWFLKRRPLNRLTSRRSEVRREWRGATFTCPRCRVEKECPSPPPKAAPIMSDPTSQAWICSVCTFGASSAN